MSNSKLECLKQLEQNIHNLTMRWPCGIKSIDDEKKRRIKKIDTIKKRNI